MVAFTSPIVKIVADSQGYNIFIFKKIYKIIEWASALVPPTPFLWCGTVRKSSAKGDQGQAAVSEPEAPEKGVLTFDGARRRSWNYKKKVRAKPWERALQPEKNGGVLGF